MARELGAARDEASFEKAFDRVAAGEAATSETASDEAPAESEAEVLVGCHIKERPRRVR